MGPASLDLGVRWRSRLDGTHHVDISAWARAPQWSPSQDALGMIWQTQQPVYGTRVEVQWASSKTRGLVPEFGAIGVQLQGGSRLVLRAQGGTDAVLPRQILNPLRRLRRLPLPRKGRTLWTGEAGSTGAWLYLTARRFQRQCFLLKRLATAIAARLRPPRDHSPGTP